jgi:hypothetical protein
LLDDPEDRSEDEDVGAMGAITSCSGGVTGAGAGTGAHAGAMAARADGCNCPMARSLFLVRTRSRRYCSTVTGTRSRRSPT